MGFGGTVHAMITSLKYNKRPRKSLFAIKHQIGTGQTEGWQKVLEKSATPEQLEEIRTRIAQENRQVFIKRIIAFAVVLVVLGLAVVLLFSKSSF